MSSENTSIKDLQNKIIQFRRERNWEQFHTLKDLLLGLNIEASELGELFLWKMKTKLKPLTFQKSVTNYPTFLFLLLIFQNTSILI